MACQIWGFLFGFQLCLAFSVCFPQGYIFGARPVPEEVKWSTGVFTVLSFPQELARDKLGSSSKINGTEPLQRC